MKFEELLSLTKEELISYFKLMDNEALNQFASINEIPLKKNFSRSKLIDCIANEVFWIGVYKRIAGN